MKVLVPVGPDGKGPLQGYDAGENHLWAEAEAIKLPWCAEHDERMKSRGVLPPWKCLIGDDQPTLRPCRLEEPCRHVILRKPHALLH